MWKKVLDFDRHRIIMYISKPFSNMQLEWFLGYVIAAIAHESAKSFVLIRFGFECSFN